MRREGLKEVEWVGTSRRDLIRLGEDLCDAFGTDLLAVQKGEDPLTVKHLRGGLSEIKISDADGTFRLTYVAKFEEAIYVLHVFTKKSHRDDETPKRDADLISARHAEAVSLHTQHLARQKETEK